MSGQMWIVEHGEYSYYGVDVVCSDEATANAVAAKLQTVNPHGEYRVAVIDVIDDVDQIVLYEDWSATIEEFDQAWTRVIDPMANTTEGVPACSEKTSMSGVQWAVDHPPRPRIWHTGSGDIWYKPDGDERGFAWVITTRAHAATEQEALHAAREHHAIKKARVFGL